MKIKKTTKKPTPTYEHKGMQKVKLNISADKH